MSMSLKCRFHHHNKRNSGGEIGVLATSTSFLRLFEKSSLTGKGLVRKVVSSDSNRTFFVFERFQDKNYSLKGRRLTGR